LSRRPPGDPRPAPAPAGRDDRLAPRPSPGGDGPWRVRGHMARPVLDAPGEPAAPDRGDALPHPWTAGRVRLEAPRGVRRAGQLGRGPLAGRARGRDAPVLGE